MAPRTRSVTYVTFLEEQSGKEGEWYSYPTDLEHGIEGVGYIVEAGLFADGPDGVRPASRCEDAYPRDITPEPEIEPDSSSHGNPKQSGDDGSGHESESLNPAKNKGKQIARDTSKTGKDKAAKAKQSSKANPKTPTKPRKSRKKAQTAAGEEHVEGQQEGFVDGGGLISNVPGNRGNENIDPELLRQDGLLYQPVEGDEVRAQREYEEERGHQAIITHSPYSPRPNQTRQQNQTPEAARDSRQSPFDHLSPGDIGYPNHMGRDNLIVPLEYPAPWTPVAGNWQRINQAEPAKVPKNEKPPYFDDGGQRTGQGTETFPTYHNRVRNAQQAMGIQRKPQFPPQPSQSDSGALDRDSETGEEKTVAWTKRWRKYLGDCLQVERDHAARLRNPKEVAYHQSFHNQMQRMRNHNEEARRRGLEARRQSKVAYRAQQPLVDDTADLRYFDHEMIPPQVRKNMRSLQGNSAEAQQELGTVAEHISAAQAPGGSYSQDPVAEKCKLCKAKKSKRYPCNVKETGRPCKYCKDNNLLCEEPDRAIGRPRGLAVTKARKKEEEARAQQQSQGTMAPPQQSGPLLNDGSLGPPQLPADPIQRPQTPPSKPGDAPEIRPRGDLVEFGFDGEQADFIDSHFPQHCESHREVVISGGYYMVRLVRLHDIERQKPYEPSVSMREKYWNARNAGAGAASSSAPALASTSPSRRGERGDTRQGLPNSGSGSANAPQRPDDDMYQPVDNGEGEAFPSPHGRPRSRLDLNPATPSRLESSSSSGGIGRPASNPIDIAALQLNPPQARGDQAIIFNQVPCYTCILEEVFCTGGNPCGMCRVLSKEGCDAMKRIPVEGEMAGVNQDFSKPSPVTNHTPVIIPLYGALRPQPGQQMEPQQPDQPALEEPEQPFPWQPLVRPIEVSGPPGNHPPWYGPDQQLGYQRPQGTMATPFVRTAIPQSQATGQAAPPWTSNRPLPVPHSGPPGGEAPSRKRKNVSDGGMVEEEGTNVRPKRRRRNSPGQNPVPPQDPSPPQDSQEEDDSGLDFLNFD